MQYSITVLQFFDVALKVSKVVILKLWISGLRFLRFFCKCYFKET